MYHRNIRDHAKRRTYEPRNLLALSIDVLTLFPMYEIFEISSEATFGENFVSTYKKKVRLKVIPRIYRVYMFFYNLRRTAGLSQVFIVVSQHFFHFIFMAHCFGAIWYFMSCWTCDEPDWTEGLSDHIFDPNNPLHWFCICYTYIGNLFAHITNGMYTTIFGLFNYNIRGDQH